jgi:hypothetical protein
MDDDDSTEAFLAKLIEGERVIDNAILNLYNDERAWGLSVVVGDILIIDNDFDNPPFEHDALSALLENKRSLPLCLTAEQQLSSKATTSAALDLAVKNEIPPDSFSLDGFTYMRQHINQRDVIYYYNHPRSSKCKSAKLRLKLVGRKADIFHPKAVGSHTRTCCIKNGVPTKGEGSYAWEGKVSLKDNNAYLNEENANPNEVVAPLYTDVKEDMFLDAGSGLQKPNLDPRHVL